jgi:hypothetical protein
MGRENSILTGVDLKAVRDELARILSNPLFGASKRYPALLRYVVEKTLEGKQQDLKERRIGADLFNRGPSYDTKADPIVRVTAGEVRKRLAQYYYLPEHEHELRIELPNGTYIPEFRAVTNPAASTMPTATPQGRPTAGMPVGKQETAMPAKSTYLRRFLVIAFAVALTTALLIAVPRKWSSRTAFNEFWQPFFGSSNPLLLCMGQLRATQVQIEPNAARNRFGGPVRLTGAGDLYPAEFPVAVMSDAIALSRIAGALEAHGKVFSVRSESATTFSDLRAGPAVLIGAFNNDWTIHLNEQLRFRFEMNDAGNQWWIADQQNPSGKIGFLHLGTNVADFKQDYAVISRVYDRSTEQMAVVVAGLTPYGTLAAAEFVTNPKYLAEFEKQVPRGWPHRNLQIVIAVTIVNGSIGAPYVVTSHVW